MRLPFYNNNKEYESNLSEFRIQAGLTVNELCRLAKINQVTYTSLNSGLLSPILISGKIRPAAQSLSDILNADLMDLFPRYFCSINHNNDLLEDQIIDNIHQSLNDLSYQDPETILLRKERCNLLNKILSKLTSREWDIFNLRIIEELSAEVVAKHFGCSRTRIQQIERLAMRRLRYHITRSKEFKYLFIQA